MRLPCCLAVVCGLLDPTGAFARAPAATPANPNVIFILADDLGQGDVGCYGQKRIRTPHLDRMAAEGVRFTQAYCGTSVCAPSRYALMTGRHMGHAAIRANREIQPEGQMPLPAGTFTLAKLFKDAGYATACAGKWGLGLFGTTGDPLRNGFDHFFGYNCQRHAHSYFPAYLYRDAARLELDGKTYAQDLIADDALAWVRANRERPFFLYYAITLPHGKYEIDDVGAYAAEDWPAAEKTYAAMVTRMDRDIGRLLDLLRELRLDSRTLVVFASDNGAAEDATGHRMEFFNSNGPYRGTKRTLYEGGLRVPAMAWWPGRVPAGKVSDAPWAFYDVLPTLSTLIGRPVAADWPVDGVNVLPAWLGGESPRRDYFYWELHEGTFRQAVRFGDWKAVRNGPAGAVELYDLAADAAEEHNLADRKPEVLAKATELLRTARTDSADWPVRKPAASRKPNGATSSTQPASPKP